jgi:hypothetical protein
MAASGQQKEIEFIHSLLLSSLVCWVENICDDERYKKCSALAIEGRPTNNAFQRREKRAAFDKRRASETDWGCARGRKNYAIAGLSGDRTAQRIQGVVYSDDEHHFLN